MKLSALTTSMGKSVIKSEMSKCTVELNKLLSDPVGNKKELNLIVRRYNLLKSEL